MTIRFERTTFSRHDQRASAAFVAEIRALAERCESAIRMRMQFSIFEIVGSRPDRP